MIQSPPLKILQRARKIEYLLKLGNTFITYRLKIFQYFISIEVIISQIPIPKFGVKFPSTIVSISTILFASGYINIF